MLDLGLQNGAGDLTSSSGLTVGPKTVTLLCSLSLLVFDWFLTLPQEVELVWKHRWTCGSMLFWFNRYVPFVDTVLSYHVNHAVVDAAHCSREEKVIAWFILGGMTISEGILVLRTMAIWNGHRYVTWFLATAFLAAVAACTVFTQLWLSSVRYVDVQASMPGCTIVSSNSLFIYSFVLLLAMETIIVLLTAVRARYHMTRSRSGWVTRLYQQGFMFYLYMLGITLLNVLWPLVGTTFLVYDKTLFATPQRVLHSICCTRVFFIIFKRRPHAHQASFRDTKSRFFTRRDSDSAALDGATSHHNNGMGGYGGTSTRSVGLVDSFMMDYGGDYAYDEDYDDDDGGRGKYDVDEGEYDMEEYELDEDGYGVKTERRRRESEGPGTGMQGRRKGKEVEVPRTRPP